MVASRDNKNIIKTALIDLLLCWGQQNKLNT